MVVKSHLKKSKHGKYSCYTGLYQPHNPDKITNSIKTPRYKSRLELLAFRFFDRSVNVESWSYEPYCIMYYDQARKNNDGKPKKRRYFIDIVAKIKKGDGSTKTVLVEVKHSKETVKPKSTKRKSLRNKRLDESTFITNQCKWTAAKKYCKARNYEFIILTEKELK